MAKIDFDAITFRQGVYPNLPNVGQTSRATNEKYEITRDEGAFFYLLTHREKRTVYEVSSELVSTAQRTNPTDAKNVAVSK